MARRTPIFLSGCRVQACFSGFEMPKRAMCLDPGFLGTGTAVGQFECIAILYPTNGGVIRSYLHEGEFTWEGSYDKIKDTQWRKPE